jgi:hypothetical protein
MALDTLLSMWDVTICYVHVPWIKRDKLDKKAILGIFIGYSSVLKTYKVYYP